MHDSILALVESALADVTVDAPQCATAMAHALDASRLLARVGSETMLARVESGAVRVLPSPRDGAPETEAFLATTPRALLDLLEGKQRLLDAIRADRLHVRAAAADAARVFDLLRHFVEGVARSRAGASHFDRFRRHVDEQSKLGGDP
jgi:hypothetical protein